MDQNTVVNPGIATDRNAPKRMQGAGGVGISGGTSGRNSQPKSVQIIPGITQDPNQ